MVSLMSLWLPILISAVFVFIVPYFISTYEEMGTELPFIVQFTVNLSEFVTQNGLLLLPIYVALFIAVVFWYCKAKPQAETG